MIGRIWALLKGRGTRVSEEELERMAHLLEGIGGGEIRGLSTRVRVAREDAESLIRRSRCVT
ncbi:MAG: hypothetical protein NZ920_05090 [Aigarchaeota archaeon]|nr:hypothetical protein [Aigarchaeota archaeon]MDW8093309.1 hypothetical protein [Nitrososphaerota archaeon]